MRKNIAIPTQFVVLLSMIYITLFFASATVGYKIVVYGKELFSASVLIFPLLFPFSDALAELYGSKIAKSLIWYTVLCEIIFVLLTNAAIHLPSPPTWHHQAEYNFLVGGYLHILLANVSAMIISFYLNVHLLNKWRILLRGKYYYLRSLGAIAVGEISYTIITNAITYFGVLHWNEIANIIISDYFFKMIYSLIIAYPGALFVSYIKMKYGDTTNYSSDNNPFQYRDIRKIINLSDHATNKSKSPLHQEERLQ